MERSDALVDFVIDSGPLLAPPDVARLLGLPTATLANWRSGRTGPVFLEVGRHVRYRRADLEAWIDGRVVRHEGTVTPGQ